MDNTQLNQPAEVKAARSRSRASILMVILILVMVALVVWAERDVDQPIYSGKIL